MRFEHVVHAGRDSRNRLCGVAQVFVWRRLGWTRLMKLNAASVHDVILIRAFEALFRPDRAKVALSRQRGRCCGAPTRFLAILASSGSCGVGSTRERCLERGCAGGVEVLRPSSSLEW